MLGERWVSPNHSDDESCASFFTRRFGAEFYARLIEPVLSGIYSADPATLSMQSLMPQLREMERRWGSLTAALRRRPSAESSVPDQRQANSAAWTLRGGMSSLTRTLAAALPAEAIELDAPVHRMEISPNRVWRIRYGRSDSLDAAAVVLAVPAHRAAYLLAAAKPAVARQLQNIAYSSIAVIAVGYRRSQIDRPPTSFGFFAPEGEPFELRCVGFPSLKYVGRAPDDAILVRASVGGGHHPSILGQSDSELIELVHDELSWLLKIRGWPVFARVHRQVFAIPQYRLGHEQLVAAIHEGLADCPGLGIAGNAYAGIGVPQCIASGQQAAEKVHEYLTATTSSTTPSRAESPATTYRERAHV
jgi:oxygen-dependent protoporphyrinogen oxidase